MNRPFPMRMRGRRGMRGLGYPVLPDSFVTAAGISESFSPQTPDATVISLLQSQGQQLPPDLAAKWAAAQPGSGIVNPIILPPGQTTDTPAVTPSGAPVSTQTGQTVTLVSTVSIAPGVWRCIMSDGSQRYCDANGAAINYTPPVTPTTTPAAGSQPTAVVSPTVTTTPSSAPVPGTGIVALTPSGETINSTTGLPTTAPVTPISTDTLDSITTWLEGSMIAGIPNWLLLGGAAAALFLFDGGSGGKRR